MPFYARVWSETPVDDTTGADSTTQTSDNNNNDTDETDNAAADAQAADEPVTQPTAISFLHWIPMQQACQRFKN